MTPAALAAIVASEDATFCTNDGIDWGALHEVLASAGERGPSRGVSTLTMQTVKNLFLWPGRSPLRKGLEIPMALALGKLWTKRRVLEVYPTSPNGATEYLASRPRRGAISTKAPGRSTRARARCSDRPAQSFEARSGASNRVPAPAGGDYHDAGGGRPGCAEAPEARALEFRPYPLRPDDDGFCVDAALSQGGIEARGRDL